VDQGRRKASEPCRRAEAPRVMWSGVGPSRPSSVCLPARLCRCEAAEAEGSNRLLLLLCRAEI
jgi:hypothetical protein